LPQPPFGTDHLATTLFRLSDDQARSVALRAAMPRVALHAQK
jgi:hypothetical protein